MNFTRRRFTIYEDCAEAGSPTAMHNRAFQGSPPRDPPPPISRRGYGLFANVPFEPERTPPPPRPRRRQRKERIPAAFLVPPPRDDFPCFPTPTHHEEDEDCSDECGDQEPASCPEEHSVPCCDESTEETEQPVESPRRRLKVVKNTTKKWTCEDKTTGQTTQTKIFEGQMCESEIPEGQMPECEIPEEHTSECHMPQSRMPQSRLPQSRIPRSHLPQRQLPQSQIPECRQPPSRLPPSRLPPSRLPQSRLPQSRLPQSRLPPSQLPQSRIPQRPVPQSQAPQSQIPECHMPQSRLHQSRLPQSRLPQSRLPQSRLPQSRLPQSRAPQFERPEDPTSKCQMPQSWMPQSRLPQSRLPRHRLPQSQMPQCEMPHSRATQSGVGKRGGPEGCHIRFMRNYFEYSSVPGSDCEEPPSPAQRPQLPCEPHQAIAAQPSYDLRNAEDFLQECSSCSTDPEDDAIGGDVLDQVNQNLEEMRSRLKKLRQTPPTFQVEEASVTYPASGGGSCTPPCPKQRIPLPPPKSSQRCPPRPESTAYSPCVGEDDYRFPSSPEYRRMVLRRHQAQGRTSPHMSCARNLFGSSPDHSEDDL